MALVFQIPGAHTHTPLMEGKDVYNVNCTGGVCRRSYLTSPALTADCKGVN